MKRILKLIILFLFSFNLLIAETLTLYQVIDSAIKNSKELEEYDLQVAYSTNRLNEAIGLAKPELTLTSFLAPMYKTTGNYASYENDYSKWGVFTGHELMFIQPLYGWGLNKNLVTAAENGINVSKIDVAQKTNNFIKNLVNIYFGFLLSKKLSDFGDAQIEKLTLIESELTKRNKTKDLLKFQLKYNLFKEKISEAKSILETSGKALEYYTQTKISGNNEGTIAPIKPLSIENEFYKNLAKNENPDLKKLSLGLKAREELIRAEKKKKYPGFFAGILADYKYSNVKEDQKNPWLNDDYNNLSAGAFIGMKMSLNFNLIDVNETKARLDYQELTIKKVYAFDGIILKVEKAFNEFKHLKTSLALNKDSLSVAKRLIVKESMEFDLKKDNAKDLVEAYVEEIMSIKNYYTSIINYNLKYLELIDLCGEKLSDLKNYVFEE